MSYAKELGFSITTVTDRAPGFVFDSQAAALVEAISDASSARAQARLEDFERRAARLEWFVAE
jgi:hypothetical protein